MHQNLESADHHHPYSQLSLKAYTSNAILHNTVSGFEIVLMEKNNTGVITIVS